jgi:DNA helicase-2/ATP-dependent DNA helicase PcrA
MTNGGDPVLPGPSLGGAGDVLDGLTQAQRKAVTTTEGALLVLAGPGSGKTRVITRRIAYLVHCGVPAWQILALTFTNKAAAEMKSRVAALLGEGPAGRGLTVSTFHSLCARLLRRFAPIANLPGLSPSYSIYDDADQLALIKATIAALNLSTTNFPPRSVLSRISAAKNDLLDAKAFELSAGDFASRVIAKIYAGYEAALRKADAVDFDDLLLLTGRMLKESAEVRQTCRERWQYLLIDEYQDTNRAQFVIASLLAGDGASRAGGGKPNICVVGDPDQSIYGWRGADISNILDFEKQYPGAAVVALGENFRSTEHILLSADALIRHNKIRKHKPLISYRGAGEMVEVVLLRDEHQEAALVADWIKGVKEDNRLAWKDLAVFYRTNALSRVIEDRLRGEGIPYTIARGTAFYDREEIRNAIGYLRVIANPADDVSLGRIVNVPARGIGDTSYDKIESAAMREGVPVLEMLRQAASVPDVSSRAANAAAKFIATLDGWTGAGSFMGSDTPASLRELVERVIRESGLEGMYKTAAGTGGEAADASRVENLEELVSSAAEFEAAYVPEEDAGLGPPDGGAAPFGLDVPPLLAMLRAYLERVSLVADADAVDPAQGAVTLMTLHAAKGLEFRAAALIGLEEGCLPHSRAQTNERELEEERRLCFVGITRAMDRLLITSSRYRTIRGISERTIESRFLGELPREHARVSDRSDAFEGLDASWGGGGAEGNDPVAKLRARSVSEAKPTGPFADLTVGTAVRHPQFGIGTIVSITRGAGAKAEVKFRDAGKKTLLLEYARLVRVG